MRILLMEDEPAIRSALTRGLTARGHQVEPVASLAEARALLARFAPEAMVSDLKLPDGNGLDMAEELKVPFVLMTGYGTFDDAVRAMRLGCLDFFTKPASIKDLCRALEQVATRTAAGPQVIAEEGGTLHLGRVRGGTINEESLQHRTVRWLDGEEARRCFADLAPLLPARHLRQIAAELLQAAPRGQLAINLLPDRWAVWLQAEVAWDEHRDRVSLLQDLGRACAWSPTGAVVECAHG